ncbi:tRNA (guanosine(37)-N1)-methyltransferase TrmD [Agarilytica rhodophyticola]|uniref:tRNA (guanosine(37)-N1)-methyltransferase TrmD n=1 Tax=Agarilytica rhodophyticola TaxID=1737490 RepID=UPI001C1F7CF7|nr:tRNA (guanosine(37)-N1)-methyltransferase TrmD [Agarilytica rhodophyticola]
MTQEYMLQAAVVTLFPEMFVALTQSGISRRAIDKGLVDVQCFNPRDYAMDKHRTVDDRPYGGGPGMVMRVQPLQDALQAARNYLPMPKDKQRVIYLSPQGRRLDRQSINTLAQHKNLVLIAGRYEGVDERFIEDEVDEEWSIGDYVLSGGELPAMVLLDALIRRLPGAIGDAKSAEQDSFENGLLDCAHYTRPEILNGRKVPEVLLSGDHKRIENWRMKQALGRTADRRPDLLEKIKLTDAQEALLKEYLQEQK